MVQYGVVRQLASVLTTFSPLVVLLQPSDGVAVLVGGVGHTPGAPLPALENVPPCTYGERQKRVTFAPGM